MEITEVRIKLMESSEDRLRAFCSVTFDHCFVVRDLKVIQGNHGPFVAMPSRKLTGNCPQCGTKNHLRANFCNHCGAELSDQAILHDATGRAKLYADVAHPVNARCREMIQKRIVDELNHEIKLASQPGYKSRYDDDYFDEDFTTSDFETSSSLQPGPGNPSQDVPPIDPPIASTETGESSIVQRDDLPHDLPQPHDLTREFNPSQQSIYQQSRGWRTEVNEVDVENVDGENVDGENNL